MKSEVYKMTTSTDEESQSCPAVEEARSCPTGGAAAALVEYNKNVIGSWLKRANCSFAKLRMTSPEYAEIEVSANGKTRIFGLCFGKLHRDKRRFRINPVCLDAFGMDNKCEIEKIKLLGFFAEHMDDITKELINAYKAKKLYSAWSKAWNALYGRRK